VIRVYDAAGNVIETHEHKGDFKEWWSGGLASRTFVRYVAASLHSGWQYVRWPIFPWKTQL